MKHEIGDFANFGKRSGGILLPTTSVTSVTNNFLCFKMPKSRPFRRKRRKFSPFNGRKRKFARPRTATKAVKRYVRQAIRTQGEVNGHAIGFQLSAGTTALIAGPLTDVPDAERVGESVNVTSIHCKGRVEENGDAWNRVRIIFFRWHPESSAIADAPTAGQILSISGAGQLQVDAQYVFDKLARSRFSILKDTMYTVGTSQAPYGVHTIKHYVRHPKKMVFLSNTSGTAKNHVYVCYSSTTSGLKPVVNFESLMRFTQDGGIG